MPDASKTTDYPCHSKPREHWCDRYGPGGFMGHTCNLRPPPIPLTRRELLASARLDAQAAVDALRRGEPLAADIYLKLAIDYIGEAGVLP